jgi:hypothetical protein
MSKNNNISLAEFPNSLKEPFLHTSNETINYNCIAWSVRDDSKWWWPDNYSYWPSHISKENNVKSFVELYESYGYCQCSDGLYEPGVEKIVLFADKDGKPTHAARQLENGNWTSKLGEYIDVEHSLESLSGGSYGNPIAFFRKSIN